MSVAGRVRVLSLGVVDAAALLGLRPHWATLTGHLTRPRAWLHEVGPDRAALELAGGALWCLALWLAIGAAAALGTAAPGVLGRAADRLARALLPSAARRLVAGALSAGVVLGPVTAAAAAPGALTGAAAPRREVAALVAPSWPTDPATPAPGRAAVPAPTWPGMSVAARGRPTRSQPPTSRPTSAPAGQPATSGRPKAAPGRTGRHLVVPGDSLWLIAASRLGPDPDAARIARSWPRWYAANRTVIGADPDLLVPGEVLREPTIPTPAEPS